MKDRRQKRLPDELLNVSGNLTMQEQIAKHDSYVRTVVGKYIARIIKSCRDMKRRKL